MQTNELSSCGSLPHIKRGLKAKLMETDVDYILLDPADPEIFYSKHDVGAFNVIIFIGNPNVESLSVVSDAIPVLNLNNAAIRLLL